ncbi:MAG: glycogen/starch/alpha-glucan phosphorylase, partial [Burkholderiaceae bacterium]
MNNETLDFQVEHPSNSVQALRDSIATWLVYAVGKDPSSATQRDWLFAIVYAVRERVMDRWSETRKLTREQDAKQLYYLSMEFLMGRMLTNALMAAGIYDETRAACALLGADFDALANLEAEPGLGNGGLGRLAACFMDSLATLGLPAMGYGIRYDYGMFTQRIL